MKQAMAIGARRMTSPISRIVTASRPSIALSSNCVCGVRTSISPMPKNRAKTITANMSLPAMAATILSGIIAMKAAMPCGASSPRLNIAFAPGAASFSIARAMAGSMPAPGRSRSTTSRLTATAMADTISV